VQPDSTGAPTWSAQIARRWNSLEDALHRRLQADTVPEPADWPGPGHTGRELTHAPVHRRPAWHPGLAAGSAPAGDTGRLDGYASTGATPPVQRVSAPVSAPAGGTAAQERRGVRRVNVEELAERVYQRLYDELRRERERRG
jgi:hypothetical protein